MRSDKAGGAHSTSPPDAPELMFLATAPTRPWDRQAGLLIGLLSLAVCILAVPYAETPWPAVPAFIPAYEAALLITDLITTVLLIGQFRELRRPALLVLGCGYLFDTAIIVAHALSFPGLFGPPNLIGGAQTTVWLFIAWHGLFPLFVAGYALLVGSRADAPVPPERAGRLILFGMSGALALAGLCTLAATVGHDHLPVLLDGNRYRPFVTHAVLSLTWLATLFALGVLLWRTRGQRIIDFWLAVVMGAWLLDILLSALLVSGRFQVGFYVGRLYGLLAASFLLVILLLETLEFYGRLVRAFAAANAQADKLRRSETALLQAQKMEAVGQLTGGIAHDFNNLLQGIGSSLALLEPHVPDGLHRTLYDASLQNIERGGRLTQSLLAFARRQALRPEPTDPKDLFNGMGPLLERTLGGMIRIAIDVAPGTAPVLTDRAQLESAILNLAINARDAMPLGGRLTLRAADVTVARPDEAGLPDDLKPDDLKPGDYVLVSVEDTGTGMDRATLARVFEPFFTTKDFGKGSGLGLSMVHGMAAQSGGGVAIASTVGKGTVVSLHLPRARQTVAAASSYAAAARPVAGPAVRGERKAVLLVDDDPPVRIGVAAMLDALGYRVLAAEDGTAALQLLRTGATVEAMVTDYAMPGMNGAALIREVHRQLPGLPVLLITGYSSTPDGIGRARLLRKPFRLEELAEHLALALRGGPANATPFAPGQGG